jgi:hypothetical protein
MNSAHSDKVRTNDPAANPDPITKAPGSHPVGTGIGAAVGGVAVAGGAIVAGAAMGTVAGPVGTAVGAAVGAVAGGLVGKGVAEEINPSVEHGYWREHYTSRPYAIPGASYDEYGPAYQYGWESRSRSTATNFEDVETALSQDWDRSKGKSKLKWDQAKPAARDAWERNDAHSKTEEASRLQD